MAIIVTVSSLARKTRDLAGVGKAYINKESGKNKYNHSTFIIVGKVCI